jgi:hypothetical protein
LMSGTPASSAIASVLAFTQNLSATGLQAPEYMSGTGQSLFPIPIGKKDLGHTSSQLHDLQTL